MEGSENIARSVSDIKHPGVHRSVRRTLVIFDEGDYVGWSGVRGAIESWRAQLPSTSALATKAHMALIGGRLPWSAMVRQRG